MRQPMAWAYVLVGHALALHATVALVAMVRFAAQMSPMAPLPLIITALSVVLHAIAVIINPAMAVWMMSVQMARNDVMNASHRRVLAAYGRVVLRVRPIRFAVAAVVRRAHQVSMSMAIRVKTMITVIAERMEMRVMLRMRQILAVHLAFVHLHATAIITKQAQELHVNKILMMIVVQVIRPVHRRSTATTVHALHVPAIRI